jgi:hypothetical protein
MIKLLVLMVVSGVMAGLLVAPRAAPQTAEKPVYVGPPPPEELKVLAPFVGQWKTVATIKPSLSDKEGFTSRGEVNCQWMHNGHFLRVEGFGLFKRWPLRTHGDHQLQPGHRDVPPPVVQHQWHRWRWHWRVG